MVFPAVPVDFPDPPSNWSLQLQIQPATGCIDVVGAGGDGGAHQLPPRSEPNMSMISSAGATNSMAGAADDRAHLANKLQVPPPPEPPGLIECPRCKSTNTKFCYFNNYSLSQPRHFCKTCRRYWTRGGALRNVPVGGGCRRNRRSKSGGASSTTGSKALAADHRPQAGASTSSTASPAVGTISGTAVPYSNMPTNPQLPNYYNMPLLNLADHVDVYGSAAASNNIGLSFPDAGIQQIDTVEYFQFGSNSVEGTDLEQYWKLAQFHHLIPLSAGSTLDPVPPPPQPSMGLLTFDGEGANEGFAAPVHGKQSAASGGIITKLASVKMEENNPAAGLNLRRSYLGNTGIISPDRHWGGSAGGAGGSRRSNPVVATSSGGGWINLPDLFH